MISFVSMIDVQRCGSKMSAKTIADKLFEAERTATGLECEIFEEIDKRLAVTCGEDPLDDVTYDYYDKSIELHGCCPDMTLDRDMLDYIKSLGFERGWLNHTNGTETYFYAKDSVFVIEKPKKVTQPRQSEKKLRTLLERNQARKEISRLKNIIFNLYKGLVEIQENAAKQGHYLTVSKITEPLVYSEAKDIANEWQKTSHEIADAWNGK